jgi:choline-phosphate cytidylyltransferase
MTSFIAWGPFGLLPVFKMLGLDYTSYHFDTIDSPDMKDIFTKLTLRYPNAVANINVGVGVKSESDLRISGTKGYIYVPSPWWKTDYFELRFENAQDNKRYFYKLDGEGIRMELVEFIHSILKNKANFNMDEALSIAISNMIEKYNSNINN